MNSLQRALLLVSAIGLTTTVAPAQSTSELLELLRAGERKLAATEEASGRYRCRLESTSPPARGSDSPNVRVLESVVSRRGGRVLVEIDMPATNSKGSKKPGSLTKLCLADGVYFGISGTQSSPSWSLIQFSREDAPLKFREAVGLESAMAYPLSVFTGAYTIGELLSEPTFSVTSVRTRPDGLIDADYSVQVRKPKDAVLEGTLTTSPHQGYLILVNTHQYADFNGYRNKTTRTVTSSDSSIRCVEIMIEAVTVKTGTTDHKLKFQFSDYTVEPPDKEIFTLEHYGIPTPDDDLVPWYSRWKVWALLAVSGMVLAIVFRRLTVRRRVRQQGV